MVVVGVQRPYQSIGNRQGAHSSCMSPAGTEEWNKMKGVMTEVPVKWNEVN